jgi:DNA-binding LytR/AlgR family response regulator
MSVLQLVTTFIALAVGMSDEWRMAAFRYHEAEKNKRSLERDVERLQGQVDALKQSESGEDTITVKVDLMKRNLRLDDILYVKSDGDYIVFHLSDGQAPMVLMTLKALEKKLPFGRFCRIHRSYLVNVEKVEGLKGGKVLLAGEALPLSDSCKAAFFEILSHRSFILNN